MVLNKTPGVLRLMLKYVKNDFTIKLYVLYQGGKSRMKHWLSRLGFFLYVHAWRKIACPLPERYWEYLPSFNEVRSTIICFLNNSVVLIMSSYNSDFLWSYSNIHIRYFKHNFVVCDFCKLLHLPVSVE